MTWSEGPRAHRAPDGSLRLIHGPIDLIVAVRGPAQAMQAAQTRACRAFATILTDLVAELPRLRTAHGADPTGAVARRMQAATDPFRPAFVTPMAAVAGAVADHVLAAILTPGHALTQAHVNNGGDIALWTGARPLSLAICEDPLTAAPGARARIGQRDGVGGVATSGWRGRSHSMGIADAVTVLARNAALADAAATLIANAVDLPGHTGVARSPADALSPDSDLGGRLVTTDVPPLSTAEIGQALEAGRALAETYRAAGLIAGACLACQGGRIVIGPAIDAPAATHQTTGRQRQKEPAHA
ncbi:UPF0280 family protein [Actibacterium ureilyticum]|uniref:UPF0280 family protein n=1 Tax=Actibacterium ureilyticum TaxID=1590614 RepID=UPI000BAAEBAB|nr:UPF0280 family protein [Actibacterium ureilyticum]